MKLCHKFCVISNLQEYKYFKTKSATEIETKRREEKKIWTDTQSLKLIFEQPAVPANNFIKILI